MPPTELTVILIIAALWIAVALRQVFEHGGVPTEARDWALYAPVLPLLVLGAMAGTLWYAAAFVARSVRVGFDLGRGREDA